MREEWDGGALTVSSQLVEPRRATSAKRGSPGPSSKPMATSAPEAAERRGADAVEILRAAVDVDHALEERERLGVVRLDVGGERAFASVGRRRRDGEAAKERRNRSGDARSADHRSLATGGAPADRRSCAARW